MSVYEDFNRQTAIKQLRDNLARVDRLRKDAKDRENLASILAMATPGTESDMVVRPGLGWFRKYRRTEAEEPIVLTQEQQHAFIDWLNETAREKRNEATEVEKELAR